MPVANTEVFERFMPFVLTTLRLEMGCKEEEATDCALRAVFDYLEQPERYDRHQSLLRSFLTLAARRNVLDSRRSEKARIVREQKFADVVELRARPPNEEMEAAVETALALKKLERRKMKPRDLGLLELILQGESSTLTLARPLGLEELPERELKREVKQNRDRVLKQLRRLGKEDSHDES
ncbi:sigma-70 family RNA polymerase sigma factor [Corallococcus carmarthensis]|uniref:Sigma-70 family RNA polymerase sigma factor n=1 Tax=Corallococcus carmarthensis TaxID=2316728 RepID=A0A3A8KDT2_9BACT|nr:sigma-70 family RNA polymerase sigma factor [Corallococcus carmarthensis]RKH06348.1 sigma-70 family RNA polymerase sigma factor [Corallococcus carmarthensis]